jgi:hypothetical protein
MGHPSFVTHTVTFFGSCFFVERDIVFDRSPVVFLPHLHLDEEDGADVLCHRRHSECGDGKRGEQAEAYSQEIFMGSISWPQRSEFALPDWGRGNVRVRRQTNYTGE